MKMAIDVYNSWLFETTAMTYTAYMLFYCSILHTLF